MIEDMLGKLEEQKLEEMKEKEYCDKEMKKATEKKDTLEDSLADMKSRMDTHAAQVARSTNDIKDWQGELAAISKEQAELDGLRQQQHQAYAATVADLQQALSGVRSAMDVLR